MRILVIVEPVGWGRKRVALAKALWASRSTTVAAGTVVAITRTLPSCSTVQRLVQGVGAGWGRPRPWLQ